MLEMKNNDGERVILVGVGRHYASTGNDPDHFGHLEELGLLAKTAGAGVVGTLVQSRDQIEPSYYVGKGKAEELKFTIGELDATGVIFDNDLSPAQVKNLETLLEVKVLDRSGIILDIFALRARTREARTQVELAQLKYLLPRLTRAWTHLSRQQGGIGMRGPGETQLEVDRRRVRQRIAHLESVLGKIEKRRDTGRKNRQGAFKVALAGYTNAGKSTLLNALSGSDEAVEDKLFKTLDSVTRLIKSDRSADILLSDTVGFIRNLPHDLVASFKSTLDEVREADLILHVIDIGNPEWEEQMEVVTNVLSDLGSANTDCIIVFNKCDRLEQPLMTESLAIRYPSAQFISAAVGDGIDTLRTAIVTHSEKDKLTMTQRFAPSDNVLMSEVYRHARIHETVADGSDITLTFTIPKAIASKLNLTDRNNS